MHTLTRRRYPERPDCWHIYGDMQVGTIARRVGIPSHEVAWGWACGFYPGEHTNGTATTFDQARLDFERACQVFILRRTDADFQEWRDQQGMDGAKIRDVGRRPESCPRKAECADALSLRPTVIV